MTLRPSREPDEAGRRCMPHGPELMAGFERRTDQDPGRRDQCRRRRQRAAVAADPRQSADACQLAQDRAVAGKSFTVVATDLRGYGDSSKPDGGEDHAAYTFRAMGEDTFDVMERARLRAFALRRP